VAAPAAAADFTLAQLPVCTLTTGSAVPSDPAVQAGAGADDESTRIGLALHRLLQWFPTPADGFDWTTTHTQAAAREFGLSPAQAAEALAMARRIVTGVAAWAWDATQLDHWGNEVELFHQGELLRLDRLVRQRGEAGAAGTWWVLDFKSHEHPERQPEYLAQMRRYQQAMALARPGEPVRLAFINPLGELIPLSPEQLAS
jgi:ATP-dependent helicase/nuclease subunit A